MWPTIGISIAAFAAFFASLFFVTREVTAGLAFVPIYIAPAWLLHRLQRPLYEDWKTAHPSAGNAGWAIPVGVGAGFVGAMLALIYVSFLVDSGLTEANEHYNRGIELREEGRFPEAIDEFSEAIILEPNLVEAYENRGIVRAVDLGDLEGALADFESAVEIDPNRASSHFLRAAAHSSVGNHGQAMVDGKRALSLSEDEELTARIESLLRELLDQLGCGTGPFETRLLLCSALVTKEDLDFAPVGSLRISTVEFSNLGNDQFRSVVSEDRYVDGYISSFSSAGALEGPAGRTTTSIIAAFRDTEAAVALLEHPLFPNSTTPGPPIGQASEWVIFGSEEGYSSHFLQFQVGNLVVYISNIGNQTPVTSDEIERLAERVCERLSELGC